VRDPRATHVSTKGTVQDVVGKEECVGNTDCTLSQSQAQIVDLGLCNGLISLIEIIEINRMICSPATESCQGGPCQSSQLRIKLSVSEQTRIQRAVALTAQELGGLKLNLP